MGTNIRVTVLHRQDAPGSVTSVCGEQWERDTYAPWRRGHAVHGLLAHDCVLDADDARKVVLTQACGTCFPHAWEDTDIA